MRSEKIRVLIVDDSVLMREAIKFILEQDPSIEVAGMAKDGREGVDKALTLKPDVITMDLKMPIMSGVEAIDSIMGELPIPIIVVSSMDTAVIVRALSMGAMDFVAVTADIEIIAADLISKVKIASRVKPLKRMKIKPCIMKPSVARNGGELSGLITIGISTGGPQALQIIFSKLPPNLPAGILVVQHMSRGFIQGLAEWLNMTSSLHVSVARAGEALKNGMIMLAPDDLHIGIDSYGKIVLNENTGKSVNHIPAIDVMMKSAAESYGERVIGVIMTGMGQDGVEGIKAIKKMGGKTISQDEKSSVIYGMNKAAIETGCVDSVVPLDGIVNEILRIL